MFDSGEPNSQMVCLLDCLTLDKAAESSQSSNLEASGMQRKEYDMLLATPV